jgi:anti-sigma factor RsiW
VTCNDATLSLGVYLVGALEPAERAEVEAHLASCPDCQRELDELAALPSMLDLLRIEDVEPMQAAALGRRSDGSSGPALIPSADLFERFAAKARGDNLPDEMPDELASRRDRAARFTRFRVLTSAAAAVIVVGAGVGIGVAVSDSSHHATTNVPGSIHVANGRVQMQVRLASQTTGTTLRLSVSGLPDDEHCQLYAIAKDGTRELAGQWNATYSGRAQFWGSTSIPRADLSQIVLLGTDGTRLVTANV